MKKLYEPTPEAAAKLYAGLVGDHGHSGGWIHHRTGAPIIQGWSNYAKRLLDLRIVVPKDVNGETRYAIVWHRGAPTGLPVVCRHHACPRIVGGLYGVNA